MALPVYYYCTTILFNVIFYSVLFKIQFENVIYLTMQEILFLATFPLYCLAATFNITLKSLLKCLIQVNGHHIRSVRSNDFQSFLVIVFSLHWCVMTYQ